MLTNEQKIKLIVDIKKGKVSKQIIQFKNSIVYAEPDKYMINNLPFEKNEYENTIDYLKSLYIHIIQVVDVSNMSKESIKLLHGK